ncbi:hypothetical protein D3C71_1392700 [compost metagenome]
MARATPLSSSRPPTRRSRPRSLRRRCWTRACRQSSWPWCKGRATVSAAGSCKSRTWLSTPLPAARASAASSSRPRACAARRWNSAPSPAPLCAPTRIWSARFRRSPMPRSARQARSAPRFSACMWKHRSPARWPSGWLPMRRRCRRAIRAIPPLALARWSRARRPCAPSNGCGKRKSRVRRSFAAASAMVR